MTQAHRRSAQRFSVAILIAALTWQGVEAANVGAADPPNEKMDCTVYETKSSSFGLGLRFGTMLLPVLGPLSPSVSATPGVNFDRKTGVAWDKNVHGLIARYVELCTRYNAGLVTKEEYETRLREIEGIHKDMTALESKVFEETRGHAQSAQQDLDRALARRPQAQQVETTAVGESLNALDQRIERLDTGGTPAIKP